MFKCLVCIFMTLTAMVGLSLEVEGSSIGVYPLATEIRAGNEVDLLLVLPNASNAFEYWELYVGSAEIPVIRKTASNSKAIERTSVLMKNQGTYI